MLIILVFSVDGLDKKKLTKTEVKSLMIPEVKLEEWRSTDAPKVEIFKAYLKQFYWNLRQIKYLNEITLAQIMVSIIDRELLGFPMTRLKKYIISNVQI